MALPAAERHYAYQEQVATSTLRVVMDAWRKVRPKRAIESWRSVQPLVLSAVVAGQLAAARDADPYLAAILADQGVSDDPVGAVQATAFTGIASDGRSLVSLLDLPALTTARAFSGGLKPAEALRIGGDQLNMLSQTMVQDAGRSAVATGIAARPHVQGHVRLLVPPSCSRCVILAGRWYRWSTDFKRHPRCDCRMIPASEDSAGDLVTSPKQYFESLPTAAELDALHPELTVKMRRATGLVSQEDTFTRAGAEAIRLGADMNQVVNVRRSAEGLASASRRLTAAEQKVLRRGLDRGRLQPTEVFGQDLFLTTEAVTRRGMFGKKVGPGAVRLMPESIFQIATDRADAIRLLRRYGYITT